MIATDCVASRCDGRRLGSVVSVGAARQHVQKSGDLVRQRRGRHRQIVPGHPEPIENRQSRGVR